MEWLHRMVDSEATKHFERFRTTKEASMKTIEEDGDHRNAPGTSFECVRLVQKLEGKFKNFSYIL